MCGKNDNKEVSVEYGVRNSKTKCVIVHPILVKFTLDSDGSMERV